MKPRIVLTHWVHPEVLAFLAPHCEVVPNTSRATLVREELLARTRSAHGLMAFMPDLVDAEFLDACPELKIVAGALKGYDNLDAVACAERGIWLTNVPDLLTVPTAELTLGLTIGLGRNIAPSDRYLRGGAFKGWEPRFYGRGIDGSTVGVIGMGAVGRAFAQRLTGFDTRAIYYDQTRLSQDEERVLKTSYVELDRLLAESDFVVVILPLTAATRHFLGAGKLARMQQGAYLINTGRGSTVDESAVAEALGSGRLAGYAADVFEFEDWARGDRPRQIAPELLRYPERTLFTTHIGSAVEDVRRAIALEAAQNIVEALQENVPRGAVLPRPLGSTGD